MLRVSRAMAAVPEATWTNPAETTPVPAPEPPAERVREREDAEVVVSEEARLGAVSCRNGFFMAAVFSAVVGLPELTFGSAALTGACLIGAVFLPMVILRRGRVVKG